MRQGSIALVSMLALAATVVASGCSSSSSSPGSGGSTSKGGASSGGTTSSNGGSSASGGSGGKSGSGGSAAGGSTGTTCTDVTSCGGDVVGTWKVTSSCLTISGDMDGSLPSLGCPTVPVTGHLDVTGTWTLNSNGTYTDNTTTTGSMTFTLAPSCLTISSIPVKCSDVSINSVGWDTTTCATDSSGKCNCTATANQSGGIGTISPWADTSGDYKVSGNKLTTDGFVDNPYCVAGSTMTITPQAPSLPVKGTVVLQKQTSPGSGGAAGSGGRTGAGGAGGGTTGAGGGTAAGGSTAGAGGAATGGKSGGGGTTAAGGATSGGGTTGAGGSTSSGTGPCDIFKAANTACVAAHSTVRALYGSYSGNLYQVKRASDSTTKDIPVLSAGGVVDSSVQESFCQGTTCVITKVYDQSGNGNFVSAETKDAEDPSVRPAPGSNGEKYMTASNAAKDPITIGGKKAYSLYMTQSQAYWRNGSKTAVPTGTSPQGIYMVTSGQHVGSGCCFDYGNGELSRTVAACGAMDAVNFSTNSQFNSKGAGSGPWVMADFECGLKSQSAGGTNNNDPSMTMKFVTAIEKNDGTSEFQLRGADATTGTLSTYTKGKLPFKMAKEGAIVLGSGGDCCYSNNTLSEGTFYEGAIVAGYPSDATDDAVQANIVAAGYGK